MYRSILFPLLTIAALASVESVHAQQITPVEEGGASPASLRPISTNPLVQNEAIVLASNDVSCQSVLSDHIAAAEAVPARPPVFEIVPPATPVAASGEPPLRPMIGKGPSIIDIAPAPVPARAIEVPATPAPTAFAEPVMLASNNIPAPDYPRQRLPEPTGVNTAEAGSVPSPGEIADALPQDGPQPAPAPIILAANMAETAAPAGTDLAANVSSKSPSPLGGSTDAPPPSASASQNATINLINLMVKRNLISRDDADSLVKQAQEEADLTRAQAAATAATAERALATQQSAPAPQPQPAAQNSDDEVRIAYVPDVVKKQITDQVTQNVLQQTHQEQLADTVAASQVPDWVKRFHVTGDVRVRYEGDMYQPGNATGLFTNFNAINTSTSGLNVNSTFPKVPQYDVDQDRDRFRFRARIGAGVDLGSNFTAGMRIASGSDDNPVTENQTLGQANGGQGGNFSKYAVWIDRAFLRYDVWSQPEKDLSFTVGRFDNPFMSTSMMWANDIGFDGIMGKGSYEVAPGVKPFLTAGAFPIFNTDYNFSTYQSTKFPSEDKYLLAMQGGVKWDINKDFNLAGAGAVYDFENVQGRVSDPILNSAVDAGNTDDSRPSFAQNGNTYIALRDFQDSSAVPGVTVQNQYYGLASKFRVVSFIGQLNYTHFEPFDVSLTGEVIKNVEFDRNSIINGGPGSNPGPQNNTLNGNPNSFDGGDTGYLIHLDAGKVTLQQLWDWNFRLSYRYVETDATLDAFTDSDFGGVLTGTNLKGYTVEGNLALSQRVWAGLRWMSADNVSGPTFHNDLVQFDLNAKF